MNSYRQSKQSVLMQEMFLCNGATPEYLHSVLEEHGYSVDMQKDLIPILNSYINRNWVRKRKDGTYSLMR